MLHIPEAELHAYLDQALSRLRCVEIESHLAECTPCRVARDEIAALRDRTTAMLARLAPHGTGSPPIAEIRRRAAVRVFKRERLRQRVAWAASVVVALGIGWGGASYLTPLSGRAGEARITSAPAATRLLNVDTTARSLPTETIATTGPQAPKLGPPALEQRPEADRTAGHHVAHQPGTKPERSARTEFAATGRQNDDQPDAPGASGRSPSSDRAADRTAAPARGDAVPVADAQGQGADSGRKASMIVTQQLKSGEVVRSIQGPVTDVATLLNARPTDTAGSGDAAAQSGSPAEGNFSFRQGDRVFNNVGRNLPSDSLRAMMRRLNLMSRVR
jgi:Putative zinc-finger